MSFTYKKIKSVTADSPIYPPVEEFDTATLAVNVTVHNWSSAFCPKLKQYLSDDHISWEPRTLVDIIQSQAQLFDKEYSCKRPIELILKLQGRSMTDQYVGDGITVAMAERGHVNRGKFGHHVKTPSTNDELYQIYTVKFSTGLEASSVTATNIATAEFKLEVEWEAVENANQCRMVNLIRSTPHPPYQSYPNPQSPHRSLPQLDCI